MFAGSAVTKPPKWSPVASAATAPAARLGVVRFLVGGYTLTRLAPRRSMLRQVVRTDPALFAPVGPARILRRPVSPRVADALNDATLITTALFTLGVRHRLVGPLHSALLTWTLAYRNSWSMVYHDDNMLVIHTLLLGASPAADAASLDALTSTARPAPHPRYGWPLHLMNTTSTLAYFVAGVAKVAGPSGWSWARGDTMRRHIAVDGIRKHLFGGQVTPTAYSLYRHRPLFTAMGAGTLALELGAPLCLLDRRVGRCWTLAMYGLHWGVRLIMDIPFPYQLSGTSFAAWFDTERLLDLLPWRG
jgi:hypothetical protein